MFKTTIQMNIKYTLRNFINFLKRMTDRKSLFDKYCIMNASEYFCTKF